MTSANVNTLPTLLDLARLRGPNGDIAQVVEVMTRSNALLKTAVWQEANGDEGHKVTARTGLPSVAWRKYNQGVSSSKSKYDSFTESIGMLDGLAKCDAALAARAPGGPGAYRLKEAMGFLESMANELESSVFYASTKTTPEKILGFAPRMDTISGHPYAGQIIDWSGSSSGNDQTSIWLVGWGPRSVYMTYPKGSEVGIKHEDLGKVLTDDGTGAEFLAYVDHWEQHAGLVIEDARYVVRIANIDTGALAGTGHTLHDEMTRALERMHKLTGVRPVFYMNRNTRTTLRLQNVDSVRSSTLTVDTVAGEEVVRFGGVPVEMTDAILNTESVIS